jgi:predicted ATP-grasp superfamily ATP-dependent carboligase
MLPRGKILAIGYSVRHIVCSGSRAGYEMYAADAIGDVDMKRCARGYIPLNPLQLQADVKLLKGEINEVDSVIIGSGFESADFDFFTVEDRNKILGNAPDKRKEVANKAWLASRLGDLGIPYPVTYTGREITEEEAKHLHYPMVAKPAYGGGGTANFFCYNEKELIRCAKQLPEFLYQEYIKGKPASISVISSKCDAMAVSVNEQLIGMESLCAPGPFVYCGNITPFVTKYSDKACEIAVELTAELGLIGSNGFDIAITDNGPVVIEVNPRIQGSLDTVELSTDLNLVDTFAKAVKGDLPLEIVKAKRYAVKAIAFARQDGVVVEKFEIGKGGIVDIPEKGRMIKRGEPIATGIGIGDNRGSAFADAMRNVARIEAGVR